MASSKGIRAGSAFVEIGAIDKTARVLKAIEQRFRNAGQNLLNVGARLMAFGGAVGAAFGGTAIAFSKTGSALNNFSIQTGETVEDLSKLQFASRQASVEFEDVIGAAEELNIRLGEAAREGTGPLAETFEKLGLDAQEIIKLPLPERFAKIVSAIKSLPDNAARGFAADEIFGGDAFKILPLLNKDVGALTKAAEDLGFVMSSDAAESATRFSEGLGLLRATLSKVISLVGAEVVKTLEPFMTSVPKIVANIISWVKANRGMIQTALLVAAAVAGAGAALVGLGLTLIFAASAFGALASIVGVVGSVLGFLISPIGLITASIVGLLAWLAKSTGAFAKFGAIFSAVGELAKTTIGGILSALKAGEFQLAADIAMTGLRIAFSAGLDFLKTKWSEFKTFVLETWFGLTQSLVEPMANAMKGMLAAWLEIQVITRQMSKQAAKITMAGANIALDMLPEKVAGDRAEVLTQLEEDRNRIAEEGARKRLELQDELAAKIAQANETAGQEVGTNIGDTAANQIQNALSAVSGSIQAASAIEQGSKEDKQLNQQKKVTEKLDRLNESSMKQESLQAETRDILQGMANGAVLGVIA